MSNSNQPADKPKPRRKRRLKPKPKRLPLYHVILWNDDEHTFEYVIDMMQNLFGHPEETGYQIAVTVHEAGRAIVYTTHLELAEMKRDQIHAFGPDNFLKESTCSMRATLERSEME